MPKSTLKRSISFRMLLFYGLGTMVGGGFYALIGEIAGEAGMATPLAFLIAGLLALINSFTYGELSSRFPVSAGEAHYVKEAFGKNWISLTVGGLVIATGVVSAATLSVATIGFLKDVFVFDGTIGITILIVLLGAISIWGVRQSVWAVVAITVIEVAALAYVTWVGSGNLDQIGQITSTIQAEDTDLLFYSGLLSGAFLGFYAFIGFEDMANMAEEVKDARKSLPRAILGSVLLTTVLYVVVSSVAVLTVPPETLAASATPLATVVEGAGSSSVVFLTVVSIFTGINGALVQIIMASRVLYGLGKKTRFLRRFSVVNTRTRTPVMASLFAVFTVLILALFFPLRGLAETTSGIILCLFALLNIALIKIKKQHVVVLKNFTRYPMWIPVLGAVVCTAMLLFKIVSLL